MDTDHEVVDLDTDAPGPAPSSADASENIRILVRIRPPLYPAEPQAMRAEDTHTLSAVSSDGRKSVRCSYDHVLAPECSQGEVYKVVQHCTDAVLAGYNSTIFAYGQTGSGKTHTMFGPPGSISQTRGNDMIGIIPRAINDIFHLSQSPDVTQFSILCSFVQLYNEQCFDMLRDGSMASALAIREDVTGEIYVQGLSEYIVKSVADTLLLLRTAEENRAIRETNMNQYSSRSHSIFQILVEQKKTAEDGGEITLKAKFNLVDLAGSEKWSTKQEMMQDHISEMTNINLSLHTLGKCISALVKRSRSGGSSGNHVPYRDSKLTRLLQDSLGGNSKTLLIATVSPAMSCIDESINTLKFADRAKQVMIQAKVNESRPIDHAMVKSLQNEVRSLKMLLEQVSMYIQAAVSRTPSPGKVSFSAVEDGGMAEGGAFLTNHASVQGRSGRLAFEDADDGTADSGAGEKSPKPASNSAKKAALFEAIQAALAGTGGAPVPPPIVPNVVSYTAPATLNKKSSAAGDSGTELSELRGELGALVAVTESQSRQLKALEQREEHTWHLLEAMQGTMKMFFRYEIEEDDMKKQVNKIFSNLKDVKQNKALYSPTRKTESQSTISPDSADATATTLPKIGNAAGGQGAGHNKPAKGRSVAGSSKENCAQRQPTVRQPAAVEKSAKSPPPLKCDLDSSSEEERAPAAASKRTEKSMPSSGTNSNGHVAFRVRGAPSTATNDDQNWQAFGGPTYTEEEQEVMLLEKIKQKKKKKRKEEKVAEWLRSKDDRTSELKMKEIEEKQAREEAERAKEEKRRQRALKQKQKLNEYYARVKSDLANIQQMNEMGLSPEDVVR